MKIKSWKAVSGFYYVYMKYSWKSPKPELLNLEEVLTTSQGVGGGNWHNDTILQRVSQV